MEKRTFLKLLDKYIAGKASAEEERLLEEYYRRLDKSSDLELSPEEETALEQIILRNVWEQIGDESKVIRMHPRRLWPRVAAAASIILALSVGGYLILHKKAPTPQIAQNQIHDIAPGGNKATLTLSDGRKIVLADTHNGTIASQGQTLIQKTADGKLVYAENSPSGTGSGEPAAVYNTLTTKRGEQYQVTLPDGSKVFLNAASSLRYPVAFTGKERLVELTGEGYFEIVHNSRQQFKVKVNGELIEDIGTHFNINAYDDEPVIKTTLIEGSVQVSQGGQQVVLKPGQATIGAINKKIAVIDADPEEAISWKNGYFRFNSEDLASIMRKVSRWYDAEIVFADPKLQQQVFSGTLTVSRFKGAAQLLSKLQLTGAMHYRIENQKIIISD